MVSGVVSAGTSVVSVTVRIGPGTTTAVVVVMVSTGWVSWFVMSSKIA